MVAFRSADAEGAKGFYLFKDQMPGEAIALACAAVRYYSSLGGGW